MGVLKVLFIVFLIFLILSSILIVVGYYYVKKVVSEKVANYREIYEEKYGSFEGKSVKDISEEALKDVCSKIDFPYCKIIPVKEAKELCLKCESVE